MESPLTPLDFSLGLYEECGAWYFCNVRGGPYCTIPRSDSKSYKTTAHVCEAQHPFVLECSAHVRFIEMWNGHFDVLQRPNRAVPDRGSVLKNNQLAALYNMLSVVAVFGTPCICIIHTNTQ